MKNLIFFLTVSCFLFAQEAALFAQEAVIAVEFNPFTVDGVSAEEGAIIEDIIREHIKKIKNVSLVFPAVSANDAAPRLRVDFIFQGKIYREDDVYILRIDAVDSRTQKQNTWSQRYRSSSDMALKAPTINYSVLLGGVGGGGAENGELPEPVQVEKLLGRWQGDGGIEQIFFLPGGQGRAYFSRGAGMELAWRVEGQKIIVEQKSKNDPRYYHVPSEAIAVLTELAEPKRWELFSYNGGQTLRGSLVETTVDYDGVNEIRLLYDSMSKAEWTKSGR